MCTSDVTSSNQASNKSTVKIQSTSTSSGSNGVYVLDPASLKVPYTTQTYATWDGPSNIMKDQTIELRTVDGKKHLFRSSSLNPIEIIEVEECEMKKPQFKKAFPFFEFVKKPYVHFVYAVKGKSDEKYRIVIRDVDCDLISFCKLLDIEYKSFAENELLSAIENG